MFPHRLFAFTSFSEFDFVNLAFRLLQNEWTDAPYSSSGIVHQDSNQRSLTLRPTLFRDVVPRLSDIIPSGWKFLRRVLCGLCRYSVLRRYLAQRDEKTTNTFTLWRCLDRFGTSIAPSRMTLELGLNEGVRMVLLVGFELIPVNECRNGEDG